MTLLEQRLMIASALGFVWWWERLDSDLLRPRWIARFARPLGPPVGSGPHRGTLNETRPMSPYEVYEVIQSRSFICCCPDYPGDLDAMFEAEKSLTDSERPWYVRLLQLAARNTTYGTRASAPARAEAWLKVKGLWEEQPVPLEAPL